LVQRKGPLARASNDERHCRDRRQRRDVKTRCHPWSCRAGLRWRSERSETKEQWQRQLRRRQIRISVGGNRGAPRDSPDEASAARGFVVIPAAVFRAVVVLLLQV